MKIEIKEGHNALEVIIKCQTATEEISKIKNLLNSHAKKISCTKDGSTHLVDAREILYFESVDKVPFLYTETDVYELSLKLYELEEMLSYMGFIRSAKSQIINTYKIESLRPDFGGRLEVTMQGGERLIVSRQYAKILKERLGLR